MRARTSKLSHEVQSTQGAHRQAGGQAHAHNNIEQGKSACFASFFFSAQIHKCGKSFAVVSNVHLCTSISNTDPASDSEYMDVHKSDANSELQQ